MARLSSTLLGLIYKSYCISKRHYIKTLILLVVPVLTTIIAIIVKENVGRNSISNSTFIQDEVFHEKQFKTDISERNGYYNISYYPSNDFINRLIGRLKNTLNGDFHSTKKESDIEKWFVDNDDKYNSYGIIFDQSDSSPLNFKYTIRTEFYKDLSTKDLFPLGNIPGEYGDLYMGNGILGLMIAVDDAFLFESGIDNSNWSVQQFPHPRYEYRKTEEVVINFLQRLIPSIIMVAYIYSFVLAASTAFNERTSGISERMKMTGMTDIMLVLNYIVDAMLKSLISTLIVSVLLVIDFGSGAISNSNVVIIWVALLLFCLQSASFTLAITAPFNNSSIISAVSFICNYVLSVVFMTFPSIMANAGQIFALLPQIYLACGVNVFIGFESTDHGVSFRNLFYVPPSGFNDLPLIVFMLLSLIGTALFSILYWYISNIKPGPYGSAKPWHFIFSKEYWTFKTTHNESKVNVTEVPYPTEGVYENSSCNAEIGLKIINLRKICGNTVAVNNVSIDIYLGQITVLLGLNGAGKTTLLSMITGMYKPTAGSINYQGYNVLSNLDTFRCDLGFCPQNDMLIKDISTWEHMIFFGMLKGIDRHDLAETARSALQEVGLIDKKNVTIDALSGGMKRKLCLALALIGFPKVIVLDEPTSGLDPESRREIWNIILGLRENRTIIITTHFMEEADVLGDQIAIMDHGEIRCYGTAMFLKKHYGAGYQITLVPSLPNKMDDIINFVTSLMSSAVILNRTEEQLVFSLPSSSTADLPHFFKHIEDNIPLVRLGVVCTPMDDVFLKVHEKAADRECATLPTTHINGGCNEMGYAINKGLALCGIQRFYALFVKNMKYFKSKYISSVFVFLLVPLLIGYWAAIGMSDLKVQNSTTSLKFDLSVYGDSNVLLSGFGNIKVKASFYSLIYKAGSTIIDLKNQNITQVLFEKAKEDKQKFYQSMIIAGDFNDTTPNLLFSSFAIHSLPIAVNLLYNSILDSNGKNYTIETVYFPFNSIPEFCETAAQSSLLASFVLMVLLITIIIGNFIKTPHTERTSMLKHLQLMTGLSPFTYWLSQFLFDLIILCFTCGCIMCTLKLFDPIELFSTNGTTGFLFLIIFLYGASSIWLAYIFSFWFKTTSGASAFFTSVLSIIVIASIIIFALISDSSEYAFLKDILRLIPFGPLFCIFLSFTETALKKLRCHSHQQCPNLSDCTGISQQSYFSPQINKELYFLALDSIIYMVLIVLMEYGFFSWLIERVKLIYIGYIDNSDLKDVETYVALEKDRVDAVINRTINEGSQEGTVVIVDGLAKKYSHSMTAVYDVSFLSNEGECFGVLGVNGAGKSTTFNILSGVIRPTQGTMLVKGYNFRNNKKKCLSFIGYCPQFSSLGESLTGRDMLSLFAQLRLAQRNYINKLVNTWISLTGLDEHCDKACGTYSGGNKRKLNTAMAFICDPSVILLDEPTSGVDPVTRRKVWTVIKECQHKKQTIIISSHSMDECEAVCDRLTIMAKGAMQCIGNVQHLKQLYGEGFVILIKLRIPSTADDRDRLKLRMQSEFASKLTLKDEHLVLMHYHLNDTEYPISVLFTIMEAIKQDTDIVEDYSVSDSSLEQIFLSFANKNQQK